ncbi:hypothetical protein BMR1_02g04115 [Babesia microti strain RI]|uniref:Uncharacterized protein n=1 Tax=Babesia microti (strain RI) TaxID=1133968 RepID=I7JAW6_BABMR|nr:hypothetical protein BMR1_02g04115 [Babesia microti strain RI]CCF73969.1 hypothetical protein BMR1_02g04115 [Babesia microti strain RI]|eukprot:XP_012648578.1 hypothetical protein BMR1_02g04115 [Babesia microti strain RI]
MAHTWIESFYGIKGSEGEAFPMEISTKQLKCKS